MSAARWLAGLVGALIVLVAGDVASEEVRARLDRLPFAVLRLARSRLPAELRERVHDQEWVPELQHVLQHAELFPLTRLITGFRFAAGLLLRAGTVAAELQPAHATQGGGSDGKAWRQRLGGRFSDVLQAVIWPVREPLPVRLYVAGVIAAAAAATGTAAASATMHARNLELFAILLACGLVAHGAPGVTRGGLNSDLMGAWILPTAVLLPPVYALIIPVPLFALDQLYHPTVTYRRAFSIAACGLVYAAASVLTHAAATPVAGHMIPPGIAPLTWVLVIAACDLLAVASMGAAILIAIKGCAPAARVVPLAVNRAIVLHELVLMVLGIAATLVAAAYPLLSIAIIPVVILITRQITARPGPAPAS